MLPLAFRAEDTNRGVVRDFDAIAWAPAEKNGAFDTRGNHYLWRELADLLKSDLSIFEFLESGSLDGVWYWDLEHPEHEWMSDRFWQTLGFDPSTKEHRAAEWQSLILQEDLERVRLNLEKHCRNPSYPYDQIVRYRHRDGQIVWIRCRGLAIRDDTGKAVRLLGAHNDVTALMREENELFRIVVEAAPTAMLVVGAKGTIAMMNRRSELLFGYEREELLGQPVEKLVPERLRVVHSRRMRDFFAAPQARSMGVGRELFVLTKTGKEIPVEVSLSPLEAPDGSYIVASVIDISERQRLVRDLQAAVQARDNFLAIASHELRTPLAALVLQLGGLHKLLKLGMPARFAEKIYSKVNKAMRNTDRLARLIDSLLEVSRISAGRFQLNLVDVDLVDVVNDVIDRFAEDLRRAGCEVRIEAPETLLGRWDRLRMEQVLVNLLTNAMRHGSGNAIDLRIVVEDDTVRLIVRDHGPGISSEDVGRIFQRFERATSELQGGGLGLGLYILRQIVEAHGGHVEASNHVEGGAMFTLFFPRWAKALGGLS